jgi:hypothetical protein
MVACEVDSDVHADLDHLLKLTLLETDTLEAVDPVKRRNWKAIDMEKFLTFVSSNLYMVRLLYGPNDIDDAVDYLIDII